MKKRIVILAVCLAAALAAALAGCKSLDFNDNAVWGNGDRVTREAALEGELKGVHTTSVIDVILDPELEGKYILEGDSNLLDLVTTNQAGGILELGFKDNINIMPPINVKAYVPFMDGGLIETSSVGSITMKGGTLTGDRFELIISSIGNIELDLEAKELRAIISSTGAMTLKGSALTADITLSSVGSFNGFELALRDATVNVSSMGSAYVTVSGELGATVSSVGSVVYGGEPEHVYAKDNGPGEVKPR